MRGPIRIVVMVVALGTVGGATPAQEIPRTEYVDRRSGIMEELSDGILLLHARSTEKAMEQWGFVQDGTFQYYSGLENLAGAILALDGPRRETRLWIPPTQRSFGTDVSIGITTGESSARDHGFTAIEDWAGFVSWLESRLAEEEVRLYLDGSRRAEATGVPSGMRPVAGDRTLWRRAIQEAFPEAELASAKEEIQGQRWTKSPSEVGILEVNARRTVTALAAAAAALHDGASQRDAEAAVTSTCLLEGGQGPSFWPWTMAGPNGHTGQLVRAFFQYDHLDRVMRDGELVRVDIGCAGGGYGADVGRTLPVSGTFSAGQSETWDLLIKGYRAGLRAIRAGASLDDVRQASVDEIGRISGTLRTEQGKEAAEALLSRGLGVWHIHGVGIESGEEAVDPLTVGAVVAYEPGIVAGPDAFYLEDMILVTETGHRVLSSGLPYTADEIEAFMADNW